MRVISGSAKGRRLQSVPGTGTRPTTDKVKESIFNMIGPYFDGGQALDLFAGSGGLGIEALSRGVDHCIFIDQDGKAIQTIKENIKLCGLEGQSEIFRNDAKRALLALIKRELQFQYIFLDPPYHRQQLEALLAIIDEHHVISEDGTIMVEHSTDVELPDEIGQLERYRTEKYGITQISLYGRREEA